MASRSKAPARRERDSDSTDSLKPLVVLVLLGTILYGAWSVVNKGPGGAAGPAQSDMATAPSFAPQIEMPSVPPPLAPAAPTPPGGSGFPPPPAMPPAAAMAVVAPSFSSDAPPTYLNAVSAPPPVAAPQGATIPPPPGAMMPPQAGFEAPDARQAAMPAPPGQAGYGAGSGSPQQSAAFASAWADAHDKLAAGRYTEALAVLSAWHDDPSLGLEESQRLEDLLGQLAGTVIYSQQDLLLPPHVVEPGETLPSIATPLAVPWQLLAKINGVTDPSRLTPGESLKIVRGPFDAIVSVSRRRLSLQVGGNYAGSFPVMVGRQIRDRIGASLSVVAVHRADVAPEQPGPGAQVAWSQPAPKSITLAEGLSIEAVADPGLVADDAIPGTSVIVSQRDLDELADILCAGSRVLVRQ